MMTTNDPPADSKRKGIGFYFYCLVILALFVGNFLTWRKAWPAKRELRKTQRFLDKQLNANRLRDLESSTRGKTIRAIEVYQDNDLEKELNATLAAVEEDLFYAAEPTANSLYLFSTDNDQSLVIELSLFSTSDSANDPAPSVVEVPLSGNTPHRLDLSDRDGQFAIRLDDEVLLTQSLKEYNEAKLELARPVRQLLTPGILTDEFDDYANVFRHRRWKTLLVRTYAYHQISGQRTDSQFVAVTISLKSKGDLYVPQRFHAAAIRTVDMTWDDEKAHYRILGVKEK